MQTFMLAVTMLWTAIIITIFWRLWTQDFRYDLFALWVFVLLVGGALLFLILSSAQYQTETQPSLSLNFVETLGILELGNHRSATVSTSQTSGWRL
jgi:hypothetical protein